jgi:hypothetical protein
LAAFTKEKTTLHDLLLKTRVYIKDDPGINVNIVFYCFLLLIIVVLWGALIPLFAFSGIKVIILIIVVTLLLSAISVKVISRNKPIFDYKQKTIIKMLFLYLLPSIVLYFGIYTIVLWHKIWV